MTKDKNQLLIIEIVRFFAAFSVLVWHYQNFTFVNFEDINFVVTEQPFYSLLWPFYERGLLGVQIFWAVSGFIFFWKYKVKLAEHLITAKHFFILRFSRLYPLHLLTLLLVCGLQLLYISKTNSYFCYQFQDLIHFIPHIFMASNWISSDLSFNGPIWSVSCEVVVYAFFYLYITKLNPGIKPTLAIFLLCALLSALHLDHNVTNCLKYFLLGGLSFDFFTLMQGSKNKRAVERNLIALLILVLGILFTSYQLNILRFKHYTFVLLILIPFVLYFSPSKVNLSNRCVSLINGAGNLTYSSYLTHFPIQLLMVNYFAYTHQAIPFYNNWFFVLYLLIVMIVSFFTYYLFEMPTQKYIRDRMFAYS